MMQAKKEAAIATGQRAAKGTPLVMLFYIVVLGAIVVAFVATGSFGYVQNALGQWTVARACRCRCCVAPLSGKDPQDLPALGGAIQPDHSVHAHRLFGALD